MDYENFSMHELAIRHAEIVGALKTADEQAKGKLIAEMLEIENEMELRYELATTEPDWS